MRPTIGLRPYRRGDLAAFAALWSDPEVMRFEGDGVPLDAVRAAEMMDLVFRIYENDPSFYVAAVHEDDVFAGHAELKRKRGRADYEITYYLERARWGRGIGGRVVELLVDEARARALTSVVATVLPGNHASVAILRRRGFVDDEALTTERGIPGYRLTLQP